MMTNNRKKNVKAVTFIMEKTKKTLNNFHRTRATKSEQNLNQSKNNKTQRVQVLPEKDNKPHKWLLNQSPISNNPCLYLNNKRKLFLHLQFRSLILT